MPQQDEISALMDEILEGRGVDVTAPDQPMLSLTDQSKGSAPPTSITSAAATNRASPPAWIDPAVLAAVGAAGAGGYMLYRKNYTWGGVLMGASLLVYLLGRRS